MQTPGPSSLKSNNSNSKNKSQPFKHNSSLSVQFSNKVKKPPRIDFNVKRPYETGNFQSNSEPTSSAPTPSTTSNNSAPSVSPSPQASGRNTPRPNPANDTNNSKNRPEKSKSSRQKSKEKGYSREKGFELDPDYERSKRDRDREWEQDRYREYDYDRYPDVDKRSYDRYHDYPPDRRSDRYDRYPRSKGPDYYYYEDDYHYKDRPSSSSSKRERERYHDWDRGRDREFDRDWSPERDWAREKERRRDWDSERERDRARSYYREPERGRDYDPDWDYEYREHDRYHDRDPYRDYDRDLYREYDRDPYRDYDGRRYDDDWDRDFDYRSDDYPDDSKLPIKRETPVAIILPSNFSLPSDLTKSVPPRQIHFAPLLSEKKNEGNKRIEVIAPHYILEKYVRRNLEPSGKIERYHRLSYCSVFAEFLTRTMAEHAIARLNRRKTLGNTKDSNYIFQFADPVKVDSMIIERHAAEREICDPPICLLLGNPDFPKDKINNYFQPFDLERIEHLPNKSILTYHRNMASVNDFYLAFGPKHLSGCQRSYVKKYVNKEFLKGKVYEIIANRLIDACVKDCSEFLIPDLYIPALKRERYHQKAKVMSKTRNTTLEYLLSGFTSSIKFGLGQNTLNFYLSPSKKVQTLRKKVKTATKERKTMLIHKDGRKYQKEIQLEIQEKEEMFNQFDKLPQPPLDNQSSRLTPIRRIDEGIKRGYLKACAMARQQPLIVARESGLTLCQSQYQNAVEMQRHRQMFRSSISRQVFKPETKIVGKRIYFEKSTIQGWGLFALEPISADSFICEYTGDLIRTRVADKREKMYEKQGLPHMYLFRIDEEYVVDATVRGGKARFLNHSCHPNCRSQIINIAGSKTISFYALKNIKPHDELTFNYKMEFEDDKTKWEKCYCGAKDCLGYLNYCEDPEVRRKRELIFDEDDETD